MAHLNLIAKDASNASHAGSSAQPLLIDQDAEVDADDEFSEGTSVSHVSQFTSGEEGEEEELEDNETMTDNELNQMECEEVVLEPKAGDLQASKSTAVPGSIQASIQASLDKPTRQSSSPQSSASLQTATSRVTAQERTVINVTMEENGNEPIDSAFWTP